MNINESESIFFHLSFPGPIADVGGLVLAETYPGNPGLFDGDRQDGRGGEPREGRFRLCSLHAINEDVHSLPLMREP